MNLLRFSRREITSPKKGLGYLSLIFISFILPVALAYYFYFIGYFIGGKGNNHGQLVKLEPALMQLTRSVFAQKTPRWQLVYQHHGACDKTCQKVNYTLKQLHILLDKSKSRVSLVFWTDMPLDSLPLINDHRVLTSPEKMNEIMALAHVSGKISGENHIFILDPHGQIVLLYPENFNYKDILYDLKHLLKVSQIG